MSSSLFFLPGPSVGVQRLGEELIKRRQQRNKGTNREGRREEGTKVVGREAVKELGRGGGGGAERKMGKRSKIQNSMRQHNFLLSTGEGK